MMFSATWPTGVQQLAAHFMTQPVKVVIGSQDLAASHSITQVTLIVSALLNPRASICNVKYLGCLRNLIASGFEVDALILRLQYKTELTRSLQRKDRVLVLKAQR